MDEDSEVQLLRTYVNDLCRVKDRWFGYVDSEERLIEFERSLVNCRVQFTTASSRIFNGAKRHFMFCSRRGAVGVYLDMPFQVVRNVRKSCTYGINRRKRQHQGRNQQERQCTDWTPDLFAPRKKPQGTKKIGCVANMHQKWVKVYPDFQIYIPPNTGVGKMLEMRAEAIRNLEYALDSNQDIKTELRIYLNMSALDEHTEHDFDEVAGHYQMMDKNVAKKITDLVRQGITAVQEVKKHVDSYVRDVLFAGKGAPDESCRAFFPSTQNIHNHIRTSLKKMQESGRRESADCDTSVSHPSYVSSYVTVEDSGEDVTNDGKNDVQEDISECVCYVVHGSGPGAAAGQAPFVRATNGTRLSVRRKQLRSLMEKCDGLLSFCNDGDILDDALASMKNVYNILAVCAPDDGELHPCNSPKRRVME